MSYWGDNIVENIGDKRKEEHRATYIEYAEEETLLIFTVF